nr:hypothetical protein [Helicobacter pylori]
MPKKQPNSAETHSKHDKYNQENAPYKAFGFIIYPESATLTPPYFFILIF